MGLLFISFGGKRSFFDEHEKRDIRRETRFCGLVVKIGVVSRITVGDDSCVVCDGFRVVVGAALALRLINRSLGFGCVLDIVGEMTPGGWMTGVLTAVG